MWFLAHIAHAQEGPFAKAQANPALYSIVNNIVSVIISPLVTALFFFTLLVFVWGMFGLIAHGDDPKGRETGTQHILWGVVGMAIMVSVYGIIRLIGNTIGVGDPFQ